MSLQRTRADAALMQEADAITAIADKIRSNRNSIYADALKEMQRVKIEKILAMDKLTRLSVYKAEKDAVEAGVKLFDKKTKIINEPAHFAAILHQLKDKKYKESEEYKQHMAYLDLLHHHQCRIEEQRKSRLQKKEDNEPITIKQAQQRGQHKKLAEGTSQQQAEKLNKTFDLNKAILNDGKIDETPIKEAEISQRSEQKVITSLQTSPFVVQPTLESKQQGKTEQARIQQANSSIFSSTSKPLLERCEAKQPTNPFASNPSIQKPVLPSIFSSSTSNSFNPFNTSKPSQTNPSQAPSPTAIVPQSPALNIFDLHNIKQENASLFSTNAEPKEPSLFNSSKTKPSKAKQSSNFEHKSQAASLFGSVPSTFGQPPAQPASLFSNLGGNKGKSLFGLPEDSVKTSFNKEQRDS